MNKPSIAVAAITALVSCLVCAAPPAHGAGEIEWTYLRGKGYVVCDALLKHLKRHRFRTELEADSCVGGVMASWPGWKEPPWQELDAREHEQLVYRLMRYARIGPQKYDAEAAEGGVKEDPEIQAKVKQFLESGGRVQVWRTRFTERYGMVPAPAGEQTVVQLREIIFPDGGRKGNRELCPGLPDPGWRGQVFLVRDDLSGPLPGLHPFYAHKLAGSTVFLYGGKIHLKLGGGVSRDFGSGFSMNFCELEYKARRR